MKSEKEKFIEWMISKAGLRENSSRIYATKVENRITSDLKGKVNFKSNSLFDISNPLELKSIYQNWYSVEEIRNEDEACHNQDSCSFKRYIDYRTFEHNRSQGSQIKFIYRVDVNNDEWSETKTDLKWENYSLDFTSSNPFIAREQAFNHAKSYEENFFEANKMGVEHFFENKNDIYKDFTISVSLIHPETLEEIKIDDFRPMYGDDFKVRYGIILINHVLEALEKELELLKKHNVQLNNKTKKIKVINYPKAKTESTIEVIPTPYINSDEITIPDWEDML